MSAILKLEIEQYWQECVNCGVWFGMPKTLDQRFRQNKNSFYCPHGHSQVYLKSDADRLREELDAERQRVAMEASMRRTAEQQRDKAQKALRIQTKRVNAGVCPHCNRTFQQLARHMQCKHSDTKQ